MALKQLKNNNVPGEDEIPTKLLKAGGIPVLKACRDFSILSYQEVPRRVGSVEQKRGGTFL